MLEIKLLLETTGNLEKFEPQMGFEPTTLRDLFGCSNHWATGDSVARKGKMWVFDSSCITQLQSEITTNSIARNCIRQSPLSISEMQPTNHPNEQMWEWYICEMSCWWTPLGTRKNTSPRWDLIQRPSVIYLWLMFYIWKTKRQLPTEKPWLAKGKPCHISEEITSLLRGPWMGSDGRLGGGSDPISKQSFFPQLIHQSTKLSLYFRLSPWQHVCCS